MSPHAVVLMDVGVFGRIPANDVLDRLEEPSSSWSAGVQEKDHQVADSAIESRLAVLLEDPLIAAWAYSAAVRYGVSELRALHILAVGLGHDGFAKALPTTGHDLIAGGRSPSGLLAGRLSAPGTRGMES